MFLSDNGITHVFGVTGGGSMHLNDSIGNNKKISFINNHHEQAAAMAAEGFSRISGKLGVVHITTGPGGTNAITGVVGAWIDSIPMLIISGQVNTYFMINNKVIRQFGIQEVDIINYVKDFTKYSVVIKDANKIKYYLEKAIYIANSNKPGPVWIDIPLDIQRTKINISNLSSFKKPKLKNKNLNFSKLINLIKKSKKPVFVIGNGIRIGRAVNEIKKLSNLIKIPILSSWNASDLLKVNDKNYIGKIGLFGDRASNFTIQSSDLVIVIGSRLSQPMTGYELSSFAPKAKIVMNEIDLAEIKKFSKKINLFFNCDSKFFLKKLLIELNKISKNFLHKKDWLQKSQKLKNEYPVVLKKYKENKKFVNSFYFIDQLFKNIKNDSIVVTDMGTSFTCTMQTYTKTREKQRLFTSSGLASMGFGLPGSIGAHFASKKSNIICISGDGGFMFNMQELQTVSHHKIPLKIFILNNSGYLTMKLMQNNHFKNYVGSNKKSGLSFPNFIRLAKVFNFETFLIKNTKDINKYLEKIINFKGPVLTEILMDPIQPLIPRVQSMMNKDGSFQKSSIENMYPFISQKTLNKILEN